MLLVSGIKIRNSSPPIRPKISSLRVTSFKVATKSIKLFDDAGELKNTYDVLTEISEGWNQMSNAEQSSLAISLAG